MQILFNLFLTMQQTIQFLLFNIEKNLIYKIEYFILNMKMIWDDNRICCLV